MNAADIVESLFKLGVSVRDAFVGAKTKDGSIDWAKFIQSQDFKDIEAEAKGLLSNLTASSVDGAVAAVDAKCTALKKGRAISALSADELHQYSSLLDARSVLVQQQLKQAAASAGFFSWLVDTALPVLVPIAKTVIQLLL